MKYILLIGSLCSFSFTAFAQNTYLDSTFGTNGYVVTEIPGDEDESYLGAFNDVVLQPDGKIIAAGTAIGPRLTVMRYNSDGTLDNTFGTAGIYQATYSGLSSSGHAVVLQPDGKILIGCEGFEYFGTTHSDFMAIRLLPDGTPDSFFGVNGIAIVYKLYNDYLSSMALQPDGKIVLCGTASSREIGLARLLPDGQVDSAFGVSGFSMFVLPVYGGDANSVAVQPDGRIVVGGFNSFSGLRGYDFFVARFQNNGLTDSSFGVNGIVYTDLSGADFYGYIALQSDGKIVQTGRTGGMFSSDMVVLRYHENGTLDTSFNSTGYRSIDFYGNSDAAFAIEVQSDGKIGIGGSAVSGGPRMMSLTRINADGVPDSTFGENSLVSCNFNDGATDLRKFVFCSDDKIIAVGSYTDEGIDKFLVAKIKPQAAASVSGMGKLEEGMLVYPNPARDVMHIKSNFQVAGLELRDAGGRLVKSGHSTNSLNLSGLPGGVYSLHVRLENGELLRQKITVIN